MNTKSIDLPILWYTDEEIKELEILEKENEKRAKNGLSLIDSTPKEEIFSKDVAFFGFSEITPHDYQGHEFCKIYSLVGNEYICTMTREQALEKIKNENK